MATVPVGPLCSRFTALGVVHRARGGHRAAFGPRFRRPETACDLPPDEVLVVETLVEDSVK